MGCGASKSSKVAPDVIDTKPQAEAPADGNSGDATGDCPRVPPVYISAEPQTAVDQEATDQSVESNDRHNETVVKDSIPDRLSAQTVILAYDKSRDHMMSGEAGGETVEGERQEPTDQPKVLTPVAFEVDMRPDGSTHRKTLPPRRLESLESAPKLTTDMLMEKQKQVEQRRMQELEKRKGSGLPIGQKDKKDKKKNKLMKDIMAARELQAYEEQKEEADKLSSSDSDGSEKLRKAAKQKHKDVKKDKDEDSAEMEVDDNFNAASSDEL